MFQYDIYNYIPKKQQSTIQNLIYPKIHKKMDFEHHIRNLSLLDKLNKLNKSLQQEEIKQKEEAEKIVPYKLKQFEKIPSCLYQKTEEWVKKESEKRKFIKINNNELKPTNNNYISPYYNPNGMFKSYDSNKSMFEQYYKDKIKEYKILRRNNKNSLSVGNIFNNSKNESMNISNINKNNNNENNKIDNNNNENNNNNNDNNNDNNNINNNIKVYKSCTKIKPPLPKKFGIILPKIPKNYLRKNINIVKENKILPKFIPKIKNNFQKHKNYGKIPNYILNYRKEEEEYLKQIEEEKNKPKNMELLPENERIKILNDLIDNKNQLENLLEHFPISNNSIITQKKKENLINKIIEIEKAIEKFSKKKVYIKI